MMNRRNDSRRPRKQITATEALALAEKTQRGAIDLVRGVLIDSGVHRMMAPVIPAVSGISNDMLAADLVNYARKNPAAFRDIDVGTLQGAMLTCAQYGLRPGHHTQAYLVPYRNERKNGIRDITLIVGYKGLIEIACRTGRVRSVSAEAVRDGDRFDFELGTTPFIRHQPQALAGAPITHYYAVTHYTGGGQRVKVWTAERAEDHYRRYSKCRQRNWVETEQEPFPPKCDCPWCNGHRLKMHQKNVIRDNLSIESLSPTVTEAVTGDEQVHNITDVMSRLGLAQTTIEGNTNE